MIRSRQHILGVPGIAPKLQDQVDIGTQLMKLTAQFCAYASQASVPWVIENPQSSLIWHTAEFSGLCRDLDVSQIVTHMCGFGTRWKKPTTLWSAGLEGIDNMIFKCSSYGCQPCQYFQKPHIILSGSDPHGVLGTKRAAAYPYRFGSCLAKIFIDSGFVRVLQASCRSYMTVVPWARAELYR